MLNFHERFEQHSNIANRQFVIESMNASTEKKTDLFYEKNFFRISKKKIGALKALRVSRTIDDWHFFDKVDTI